jgi:hypothetical protein
MALWDALESTIGPRGSAAGEAVAVNPSPSGEFVCEHGPRARSVFVCALTLPACGVCVCVCLRVRCVCLRVGGCACVFARAVCVGVVGGGQGRSKLQFRDKWRGGKDRGGGASRGGASAGRGGAPFTVLAQGPDASGSVGFGGARGRGRGRGRGGGVRIGEQSGLVGTLPPDAEDGDGEGDGGSGSGSDYESGGDGPADGLSDLVGAGLDAASVAAKYQLGSQGFAAPGVLAAMVSSALAQLPAGVQPAALGLPLHLVRAMPFGHRGCCFSWPLQWRQSVWRGKGALEQCIRVGVSSACEMVLRYVFRISGRTRGGGGGGWMWRALCMFVGGDGDDGGGGAGVRPRSDVL